MILFLYYSEFINIIFDSNVPSKFFDSTEQAVKIMNHYLILKRNITVLLKWEKFETSILAHTAELQYFYEDPAEWIVYPSSLFKQLYDRECSCELDITITINANMEDAFYWKWKERPIRFFEFDLQSIVLHELLHGLGVATGFYFTNAHQLAYSNFDARVTIFDWMLLKEKNITGFPPRKTDRIDVANITNADVLTNGTLDFCSLKKSICFPLYAPLEFVRGSSLVHRTELSLLNHEFFRGQQYTDMDMYSLSLLEEMGYEIINCGMPNRMKSCGYCTYLEPCNDYSYNRLFIMNYILNHVYFIQILLNILF